jgi:hypothetical protein
MSVFEKGEFLQQRIMTKNDSDMSQMSKMAEAEMSEYLQQRKMPKNDQKSMLVQSEMPNSNFGIARSSSFSKVDQGMRKKLSNSITNLTGKLSRSKTVHGAHGGRKTTKRPQLASQSSQKSQTNQDLDAMDDILQSISSINLK